MLHSLIRTYYITLTPLVKTTMKLASAVCWSLPHKWCVAGHVNESVDKSNAMSENCYMHAGDVQMIGHIHPVAQLVPVTLNSTPIMPLLNPSMYTNMYLACINKRERERERAREGDE